MLEANFEFNLFELDYDRVTKTLDRTMGQIIREAAREWLRTILINGVPVETGMAKATFQPLGRFLSNVNVNGGLAISPTRKPYYSKLEGTTQDIASGNQKQEFYVHDDKSHPQRFIYEFYWATDVLHWFLERYYNGAAIPGEYSIEMANEAMEAYVVSALERRLPRLYEFLFK